MLPEKKSEKCEFLVHLRVTVKLGYNELSYNKRLGITSKDFGPKWWFSAQINLVITNTDYKEQISRSLDVRYNRVWLYLFFSTYTLFHQIANKFHPGHFCSSQTNEDTNIFQILSLILKYFVGCLKVSNDYSALFNHAQFRNPKSHFYCFDEITLIIYVFELYELYAQDLVLFLSKMSRPIPFSYLWYDKKNDCFLILMSFVLWDE